MRAVCVFVGCVTADMYLQIEPLERLKEIGYWFTSSYDEQDAETLEELTVYKSQTHAHTHTCGDSEYDNRPRWPLAS